LEDVKKYWENKEREINEKIKGKFLCRYVGGYKNFSTSIWGLIYYTDKALYFESVPRTRNWFENMITKSNSAYTKGEEKNFTIRAPWEKIEDLNLSPKESWLKRTFLSSERKLTFKIHSESITIIANDEIEDLMIYYKDQKMKKPNRGGF